MMLNKLLKTALNLLGSFDSEFLFEKEVKLSKFNPIKYFVTPSIFVTEKGEMGAVIQLTGQSYELTDTQKLNQMQKSLSYLIRNHSTDMAFYITHHRRRESLTLKGGYEKGFVRDLMRDYHQPFQNQNMLVSDWYLTLIAKPVTQFKLNLNFKKMKSDFELAKVNELNEFQLKINNILQSLGQYNPKLLGAKITQSGLILSEALSFLSILVNGYSRNFCFPLQDIASFIPQGQLLIDDKMGCIHFESDLPDRNRFAAILSIKQYAAETQIGMLNGLMALPFECIETGSFYGLRRNQTLSLIEKTYNRFVSTDDAAKSQLDALKEASDWVAGGEMSYGLHHHTLMVLADNIQSLEENVSQAMQVYEKLGIAVIREKLNLKGAYFSQIPANLKRIKRQAPINNHNFSCLYPLHADEIGYRDRNHLGDALMIAVTKNQTPFYFNIHAKASGRREDRSHGHTLLLAPTYSGKTAQMTMIDAALQKYPMRSFFFDRNRGCEIYVLARGGRYYRLNAGKPTGLNPCQLSDTPKNREFLRSFFKVLSTYSNETLTAQDESCIDDLVAGNYTLPFESRNLSTIAAFLPIDFKGRESFFRYIHLSNESGQSGRLAYLFDNTQDTLTLNVNCAGFDLTDWLSDSGNEKPELVPLTMYLFHRLEETFGRELTGIYFDEGLQYLKKGYWSTKIAEYVNTRRKDNVFIMLAAQDPKTVVDSAIGQTLVQGAATLICFSNPNATEAVYCGQLNLSKKEFEAVKELNQFERYFLYKQNQHSAIVRFPMSDLSNYLKVLSSNSASVDRCESLRHQFGDAPENWLPEFLKG